MGVAAIATAIIHFKRFFFIIVFFDVLMKIAAKVKKVFYIPLTDSWENGIFP
jgi:hypothetical protein